MVDAIEGGLNNTFANKTENCTLHDYRVWPSSCSDTMILYYKWISLVLGLAFTASLSFHFKNFGVRLIQSKFKVNIKDSTVRINIMSIMTCVCGMVTMSNYHGYHHNDYCLSTVAASLCTSLIVTIT